MPSKLTVDDGISGEDVRHALGSSRQCKSQRAQQRSDDGDLAIGELLEQRPNEQPREVHHDVEQTDDESSSGRADV